MQTLTNTRTLPVILIYEEHPEQKQSLYNLLEHQEVEIMPCVNLEVLKSAYYRQTPALVVMNLSINTRDKILACKEILKSQSMEQTKLLLIKESGAHPLPFVPKDRLAGYVNTPIFIGDLLGNLHATIYDRYVNMAN